ncbi:MAG: uracil-xanthine permease family protein [Campylobacterales bacterium]|nr:uracil-xanthine permease family protein [Campylobacterales bacterium]
METKQYSDLDTHRIQELKHSPIQTAIAGSQILLVAFGALVLVPLITGLNPNVALFTAGVGTLLFQIITKRTVPIFLASSFAFIAPIIYGTQTWGLPATLGGLMAAGIFYIVLSFFVRSFGTGFIDKYFPPIVVGPVIMVIGLGLAPVAVNMAMGKTGDGAAVLVEYSTALSISMTSLFVTLLVAILGKGFFKLLPILSGIVAGFVLSLVLGVVDFTKVAEASWFAIPAFTAPEFNWQAILFMLPVALAPAIEHIGDVLAISSVTGKDYIKKPGLHKTLLGDGVATSAAAMFGGPPNTTYSEVTGAVVLTKNFNPVVMTWAAVFAIALAFVEKFGVFLQSIPTPVMGGILVLLFGSIAVVGLNSLVKSGEDLTTPRNLVIISVVLTFGIGGMVIGNGEMSIKGVSLCAISAILLNIILPHEKEETNK